MDYKKPTNWDSIEQHHTTEEVVLPCEIRNTDPFRSALPVARIYQREMLQEPVALHVGGARTAHRLTASKPAEADLFTRRLARLN